jgi:hypothetical protein
VPPVLVPLVEPLTNNGMYGTELVVGVGEGAVCAKTTYAGIASALIPIESAFKTGFIISS